MILTTTNTVEGHPITAYKGIVVDELTMDVDVEWDVVIGTPAMKAIY
ncbi:heavy metal-binding domain-containing protein [uncultured Roseobacter sp.]|nr:heavy metal-binding domain-containing protein [uncultured Roseobacter sp.]